MPIRPEVVELVREVEDAALTMRATLARADRIWNRGGWNPDEVRAMRAAEQSAQNSVRRIPR